MTGYTRADFENGLIRRDDLTAPESIASSRDAAQQLERLGRSLPYEKEYVRRDGSRCWALFASARIDAETGVEFVIDITDRKVADEALRASIVEREREQLLRLAVESQEQERQRIARELHDEMGQHLTALKLGLEALQPSTEPAGRLLAIVSSLDQSIDRLTFALRPPALDELGLQGAVTLLAEQMTMTSGLRVDVHLEGLEGRRVPENVDRTIYRVIQEALTNVSKHAEARTVSVIVERQEHLLRVIVEDDGKGFSEVDNAAGRARFGLIGMRERLALVGGALTIESQPERGTTLYISVPIPSTTTASS
jgi:chemotaxis family two-component system sensor kinase Cph1